MARVARAVLVIAAMTVVIAVTVERLAVRRARMQVGMHARASRVPRRAVSRIMRRVARASGMVVVRVVAASAMQRVLQLQAAVVAGMALAALAATES